MLTVWMNISENTAASKAEKLLLAAGRVQNL